MLRVSKMFTRHSTAFGRSRINYYNPQSGRVDGVGTVGVVDRVGTTFKKAGTGDDMAQF
jgi:hypothetical protein